MATFYLPGVMWGPAKILGRVGSEVLMFFGYKQTPRHKSKLYELTDESFHRNSYCVRRLQLACRIWTELLNLRPNPINLSRVLNLSRGSNMVGFSLNCIQFFKIQAGAQLKPVFKVEGFNENRKIVDVYLMLLKPKWFSGNLKSILNYIKHFKL